MSEHCPQCHKDSLVWSHRGTTERHRWVDGEGSCGCDPRALCVECDLATLRDHGLLLLDGDAFPSSTEMLLN